MLAVLLATATTFACGVGRQSGRMEYETMSRRRAPAALAALRDSVTHVLAAARADSAFPAAIAIVGDGTGELVEVAVGQLDWAPSPAPDRHTLWDLASLTKVIGTTTALMQLAERGALDLGRQRDDLAGARPSGPGFLPRGRNQGRVGLEMLHHHRHARCGDDVEVDDVDPARGERADGGVADPLPAGA